MAAAEITNLMRLVSHLDVSNVCSVLYKSSLWKASTSNTKQMSSWLGFCLYVAAGVILKDVRKDKPNPQSTSNLEFIISAMKAVGKKHVIADHFAAQLELEIGIQGVDGMGMANAMNKLHNKSSSSSLIINAKFCVFPPDFQSFKGEAWPTDSSERSLIDLSQTTIISTATTPIETTQAVPFDSISQRASASFAGADIPSQPNHHLDSGSENIDTEFSWPQTGNTPSSDASMSNATYPVRGLKQELQMDNNGSHGNWIFDPDATRFTMNTLALNVMGENWNEGGELRDNELLNDLLNGMPVSFLFPIFSFCLCIS